ncbi:FAD-binding oxidoreductase [Saccharothrix mutabilis subsp. mutabilis]|uniref:FAD-binding oxidoreductase n=1 Tax=Saccharothrix mutabilis subsp. mutabilis TaxID=66855 RepID=A0ABN0UBB4_9PSEU
MPVNRRFILRTGAATAATLALGCAHPPGIAATAPARGVDESAWRELLQALSPAARLSRPGAQDYQERAAADNQRYASVLPAAVLACASEPDVRAALRWCAKHAMPFAARSGGHNYAGHSTTTGLVISLRPMNRVLPHGHRLHLGGGATNSDVYAARDAGLYFPGGRCGGVGVAGLTLGGGLGFNDRKWGLTCDRLVETRVVLADGTLVRAADDENADLFWACRGGAGGNFGVNTAFVFDAVPVNSLRATVFSLSFGLGASLRVVDELQHVLDADHTHDFDVRIGFKHAGDGTTSLTLLGQRLGPEDALRRLFGPLLRLDPSTVFIEERGFWAAQDHLMDTPGPKTCYASKSLVPDQWLRPDTVAALAEWTRTWHPGPARATGYVTLFAMGGASAQPRPDETAYPHRSGRYVIDVGTHWAPGTPAEQVNALLAQIRAMHHTLRRHLVTDAAYVNFPDPDLDGWEHAYYGANHQRLTRVKRRYDPTGLFRYPQAIGKP